LDQSISFGPEGINAPYLLLLNIVSEKMGKRKITEIYEKITTTLTGKRKLRQITTIPAQTPTPTTTIILKPKKQRIAIAEHYEAFCRFLALYKGYIARKLFVREKYEFYT
jgi:hypothetical protein